MDALHQSPQHVKKHTMTRERKQITTDEFMSDKIRILLVDFSRKIRRQNGSVHAPHFLGGSQESASGPKIRIIKTKSGILKMEL